MTVVSCVLLWLAFGLAVCLLVLAGIGLSWVIPRLLARYLGKPGDSDRV